MKELEDFNDKLIARLTNNLTDIAFQIIEGDRELMQDYLHLLQNNKLNVLNSNIAKVIKKRFKLKNADVRNMEPGSFLIQSHQEFDLE